MLSLALSREIRHRREEAIAHFNLGVVLLELGEREGSEERHRACLAVCEEIGYRHLECATRKALGLLRAGAGDEEGARELFAAARDLARELSFPGFEVGARCELALLPRGDPADALAAYAEHEAQLTAGERQSARFLLWKATGDRAHLEEAKRLLDEALAKLPEEHRAAMRTNLSEIREILAAWRAETEGHDDAPRGTGSIDRLE